MIGISKSKKIITALIMLPLILCSTSLCFPATRTQAQEIVFPDLHAHAAILMESSRAEIIFAKNSNEIMHPASLTKIMTLILAYEALETGRVSWDEEVTVSQKAWETGGSQMFLKVGQKVSFGELVTGIATISANDACVAIAEHLYGSEAIFVQEMNKKARELELKNTLFQNSSGLPHPEHYTTAEDVAVLAHNLISNFPQYLKLHSQMVFTFNEIVQYNRNPLLGRFKGADGLKTGHTNEAGHCLVGTAVQEGLRFITVVMNAPGEAERLKDTETMLNYAFRNYTLHRALPAGEVVADIAVKNGEQRRVDLVLSQPAEVVIPFNRQEDLEIRVNIPENVSAPVEKDASLGNVEILLDGNVLLERPLLASTEIKKAGFFPLLFRSFGDFVSSSWNKLVTAISELLLGGPS